MKLNKVVLSSSLAITAALAGISIAQGSAHAETVSNSDTTVTTQVATTSDDTQNVEETTVDASQSQANAEDTQVQANVDDSQTAATQASAEQPSVQATSDDSDDDALPTTARGIAADVVGNHIVAPITETALSVVKPISNVYAGGAGLINPSSNVVGRVTKDVQNAGINIVGDTLGKLPKKILQTLQPLDLTPNNLAGIYGLATGKNDTIPNKVGQKVADKINGDTAEAATTEDTTTPVVQTYSNQQNVGTVTTNKLAPLFTANGAQSSRSLAAGSDWYTDILRTNNTTGQQLYRVSTNEYVRAQDVSFN